MIHVFGAEAQNFSRPPPLVVGREVAPCEFCFFFFMDHYLLLLLFGVQTPFSNDPTTWITMDQLGS